MNNENKETRCTGAVLYLLQGTSPFHFSNTEHSVECYIVASVHSSDPGTPEVLFSKNVTISGHRKRKKKCSALCLFLVLLNLFSFTTQNLN